MPDSLARAPLACRSWILATLPAYGRFADAHGEGAGASLARQLENALSERSCMGKATIFYFTGTGNSLAVARALAAKIWGSLVPVASTIGQASVESDVGVIGFVFPIYDFKAPKIMEELLSKLASIDTKYLFAVCTYGIAAGQSLKRFGKTVEEHGGHLCGGFAVAMPHTGVGCRFVSRSNRMCLLEASLARTEPIAGYIERRLDGTIESSRVFPALVRPWMLRTIPVLARFAGRLVIKGEKSLALTASDECNGCGICAKLCPVENIEMVGEHARWSDHCLGCFACLHWCPRHAISLGGQDMGIDQYHHPDVTLSDMIQDERDCDIREDVDNGA
jgi:Pyruvate/2-oxoacid:ferredoxin oxidoreductase delta subunit/flavodoxin